MKHLKRIDPEIYETVKQELLRQQHNIELIASENFTDEAVLEAQGSCLTNKYAEGYPAARWYGGCEHIDVAEELAVKRAKEIFGADHVNVQPHAGSQANMAVYFTLLEPGDTVMAMDLACGGHLTHGHAHNFSGRYYKMVPYGVSKKDEMLDYDELMDLAVKNKPKMILAGACAYPRTIDFKKFREIAERIGAYLVVDMAHIAGLVAAGIHPSPIEHADIVTTTTHKTLRGPRGGMILCKEKFAKDIDAQVFPGIQGGPLMHVIAAKAVALKEALEPSFKDYQQQIVKNASAMAEALKEKGYRIVSGGTDNHLLLVEVTSKNTTGKDAAEALDKARITVNKNLIPFDTESAAVTSGIRLGSPAVTTRGMKEAQMVQIAEFIDEVLSNIEDDAKINDIQKKVSKLAAEYPLYTDRIKAMG